MEQWRSLVSSADLAMVRKELMYLLEIMRREAATTNEEVCLKTELSDALTQFLQHPCIDTGTRLLEEAPIHSRYFESCSPGGESFEVAKYLKQQGILGVHLHFVGENGFYPSWAKDAGRWVFQRTLLSVGDFPDVAAQGVRGADQVIVWSPLARNRMEDSNAPMNRNECLEALRQLTTFPLRCYGNDCIISTASNQKIKDFVCAPLWGGENPEEWLLICPSCMNPIGPDLESVIADPILERWGKEGYPPLDNPAASSVFRSAPIVVDLQEWIRENDPSHLELAYLAQQLWPDIGTMLRSLTVTV